MARKTIGGGKVIHKRFKGHGIGPGGMKCACCADAKKRGKRKNRALGRMVRHRENQEIRRRILEDWE